MENFIFCAVIKLNMKKLLLNSLRVRFLIQLQRFIPIIKLTLGDPDNLLMKNKLPPLIS